MHKERNRVAVEVIVCGQKRDSVQGGLEQSIGPKLHLVADVDEDRVLNKWRRDPFGAARLHFKARNILLEQQRDASIVAVRTCTHRLLVRRLASAWVL